MNKQKQLSRNKSDSTEDASNASAVLALSLFIILLAFFIVLNGLSQYSEPKVGQAIESLESAFSQQLIPNPSEKSTMDERNNDDTGQGTAVEELQSVLKSLLPNLNLQTDPNPDGGQTMAVRMTKNQFDRLSKNLMPLFVRILTEKDRDLTYMLTMTAYTRDPLSRAAQTSFEWINGHADDLVRAGLSPTRVGIGIETGNPAIVMFTFNVREAMGR